MLRTLSALLLALSLVPLLAAQAGRGNQERSFKAEEVIYLTGQVVVAGGGLPPNMVAIERHCRGQVFPEGFTDQQGAFAVRLGSRADAATEDASTYGVDSLGRASGDTMRTGGLTGDSERHSHMKGKGTVDLFGCELRARLAGFIADPVLLGRRSTLDDPDVGTIVLRPLGKRAAMVSVTSNEAPGAARKLYQRAAKRLAAPKPNRETIERDLLKAVEIHPRYAAAWKLLGDCRVQSGAEDAAAEAYSQAIEADSMLLAPYRPRIKLALRKADWNLAAELAGRYLELDPSSAEERFYLALAQQQSGQADEALDNLDRLFSDPVGAKAFPQARHVQGALLADLGRYPEAAKAWEAFAQAVPDSPATAEVRQLISEWRRLGAIE